LDLGLEGRWELTALESEKGSQWQPLQVELKRAGQDLQIIFPGFKQTFHLAITPEKISLTAEKPPFTEILYTARREPASETGKWMVSIIDRIGTGSPKTVARGPLTISEDWHVWEAELTETDSRREASRMRLHLAIVPGEKLARFSLEDFLNLGKPQFIRGVLHKQ
jgi:hypothetical protein